MATGIVTDGLYRLQDVEIFLLNLEGSEIGIGGDRVYVALQSIRACLFNELSVLRPSTYGSAVEAGDDRQLHCLLGAANVIQISLRPKVKFIGLREETGGLGEAIGTLGQMVFEFETFLAQLFFE